MPPCSAFNAFPILLQSNECNGFSYFANSEETIVCTTFKCRKVKKASFGGMFAANIMLLELPGEQEASTG